MAFEFKPDESVTQNVRKMARKEIGKALAELTDPPKKDRNEAVHSARKRFKKLRALLRLVRDGLGDRVYRKENVFFRDAGRPLTEVRDAKVLGEALDKLADSFAGQAPSDGLKKLQAALEKRRKEITHRILDEHNALAEVARRLRAARRRVKNGDAGSDDWSTLGKGLKRVYRQGRDACAEAADDRSVENLHEWRKQTKYLRAQLEMLRPTWPEVLEGLADQAHHLGDLLGDDHDLAVLHDLLEREPDMAGSPGAARALLALIDRRREELQEEALRLGPRLYADKPRAFTDRFEKCWEVWRAGGVRRRLPLHLDQRGPRHLRAARGGSLTGLRRTEVAQRRALGRCWGDRARGGLRADPPQGGLPATLSHPARLPGLRLAGWTRGRAADGCTARRLVCGLLLGPDGGAVCIGPDECRLDASHCRPDRGGEAPALAGPRHRRRNRGPRGFERRGRRSARCLYGLTLSRRMSIRTSTRTRTRLSARSRAGRPSLPARRRAARGRYGGVPGSGR
jgi:CHAD domain-containing protein